MTLYIMHNKLRKVNICYTTSDPLDLLELNVVEGTLVIKMMINNWSLILFMQMRPCSESVSCYTLCFYDRYS